MNDDQQPAEESIQAAVDADQRRDTFWGTVLEFLADVAWLVGSFFR